MTSARPPALQPGFTSPVIEAQRVFRRLLEAMSRPGTVQCLDLDLALPAPLAPGAAALCLTLADMTTPLWLDGPVANDAVVQYLRFHTGAPVARRPQDASFALIGDAALPLDLRRFAAGDDEYPERSTTIVMQVADLRPGEGRRLSGPGIEDHARLAIDGLDAGFWPQWQANHALFPRGCDVVFVAGQRIAALPRSTAAEA
jgi:alpha-D-ribose 1-methylphosphonate 5-triphosphate synthase subunit PhnH